jgi:Flp pilus assembly protein TadG
VKGKRLWRLGAADASQHTDRCQDGGQVTAFMVVIVTALVGVAGLVIDGGYGLAARQEAANVAEQAARVGADQIAVDSLRTGPVRLDQLAARAAVGQYLAALGHAGTVTTDRTTVTVTVTVTRPTAILGIVGVHALTVTANASARSLDGIRAEEREGSR